MTQNEETTTEIGMTREDLVMPARKLANQLFKEGYRANSSVVGGGWHPGKMGLRRLLTAFLYIHPNGKIIAIENWKFNDEGRNRHAQVVREYSNLIQFESYIAPVKATISPGETPIRSRQRAG